MPHEAPQVILRHNDAGRPRREWEAISGKEISYARFGQSSKLCKPHRISLPCPVCSRRRNPGKFGAINVSHPRDGKEKLRLGSIDDRLLNQSICSPPSVGEPCCAMLLAEYWCFGHITAKATLVSTSQSQAQSNFSLPTSLPCDTASSMAEAPLTLTMVS